MERNDERGTDKGTVQERERGIEQTSGRTSLSVEERLRGRTGGSGIANERFDRVSQVRSTEAEGDGRSREVDSAVRLNDNENKGLSEETAEKLKNTKVRVNGEDELRAVYHFTPNMDFTEFGEGDIGFHFGTKAQAEKRAKSKGDNGRYIRAYLNIKNPIPIEDRMSFNAIAVALHCCYKENILTEDQYQEIYDLFVKHGDEYNSPASVRLREMLAEKGYDGLMYQNRYEGRGISYVAFYPEQVVITGEETTANAKTDPDIQESAETDSMRGNLKAKVSTPFSSDFTKADVLLFWGETDYDKSEDRKKAKNGDVDAAFRIVNKYITNEFIDNIKNKYSGAVIVPVTDVMDSDINVLPGVFAGAVA